MNCPVCGFYLFLNKNITYATLAVDPPPPQKKRRKKKKRENVARIYNTFDNNFRNKNDFLKISDGELLKRQLSLINISPSNLFPKYTLLQKSSKVVRLRFHCCEHTYSVIQTFLAPWYTINQS